MGRIIGIVSLKGGVGKTSTVASLGAAMARLGKKVVLVDGNFSAPNLGLHLDITNPEKTVQDLLDGKANLEEVVHKLDKFDIIPAALSHKSEINYLKLKDKLKPLKKKYDAILLDSSPSLNQETLGVMLASDFIIVVTTPDYPTLSNTLKAIKLAKNRDVPIGGIIINKNYGKSFELSLEDIEESSGVPVLAVIPHDVKALKSVAEGIPYTDLKPNSKGSKEYRKLAGVLVGAKDKSFKLKNFFGWINPSKQDVNREIFYDRVFG